MRSVKAAVVFAVLSLLSVGSDLQVQAQDLCHYFPFAADCRDAESGDDISAEEVVEDQTVNTSKAENDKESSCFVTHSGLQVNVRSEPNTDSRANIVGTMYSGEALPVLSQDGNWFEVQFDGSSAWVSGTVTVFQGNCSDYETVTNVVAASIADQSGSIATEAIARERRDASSFGQTDENGNVYVAFSAGEEVKGAYIIFSDGSICESACVVESANQSGRVYGGVVNPWEGE